MAAITLLHWNVEQFSNNKLNNLNGAALIAYIAQVIQIAGANIVSLIEVKNSAVANVVAQLIPAIDLANGVIGPTQWRSISINSQKNNEAYLLLYQLGNNFVALAPAVGGGVIPINGLSSQALVAGAPGGILRFNSSMTQSGGRRPFYVAFRTTDTLNNFSVVAYHTMFGYWKGVGVRNVGLLGQRSAVDDAGAAVNMQASLTSGDFNINFNAAVPGDYNNLLNNLGSNQATNQRTTLVNNTPPGGYPLSVQYRLNAYDNIFKYNLAAPPPVGGAVPDLINESATAPVGTGLMSPEAGAFVRAPIPMGHLIVNIPPADFEDSWHIVRHAISNHLPVFTNVVI